jgi:hypothetical protein
MNRQRKVDYLLKRAGIGQTTLEIEDGIRCASYNPEYLDFIILKDEVCNVGLVIGMVRRY